VQRFAEGIHNEGVFMPVLGAVAQRLAEQGVLCGICPAGNGSSKGMGA
jgi:hypothetical protein